MKGQLETPNGEVQIDSQVIAQYAGAVVLECIGIVGMASVNMKDGIVKLLNKNSLTHGVSVEVVNNEINLCFHIIVAYGVNISAVTDTLIGNVRYRVEEFTGMKVNKLKILVEGVRVID